MIFDKKGKENQIHDASFGPINRHTSGLEAPAPVVNRGFIDGDSSQLSDHSAGGRYDANDSGLD